MNLDQFQKLIESNPFQALEELARNQELRSAVQNLYGDQYPDLVKALAINSLASGANPSEVEHLAASLYPGITSDKDFLGALDSSLYNLGTNNPDQFMKEYESIGLGSKLELATALYKAIKTGAYRVIQCIENKDTACAAKTYVSLSPEAKEALRHLLELAPLKTETGETISFNELDKRLRLSYLLDQARQAKTPQEKLPYLREALELAKALGEQNLAQQIMDNIEYEEAEEIAQQLPGKTMEEAERLIDQAPEKYRSYLASLYLSWLLKQNPVLGPEETQRLLRFANKYGVTVQLVKVDTKSLSDELNKLANEALQLIQQVFATGDPRELKKFVEEHSEALKKIPLKNAKGTLYDAAVAVIKYAESPAYSLLKRLAEIEQEKKAGKKLSLEELREEYDIVKKLQSIIDSPVVRRMVKLGMLSSVPTRDELVKAQAYTGLQIIERLLERMNNARNPRQALQYLEEAKKLASEIPVVDNTVAKALAAIEVELGGLSDIECALRALGLLGGSGGGAGAPGGGGPRRPGGAYVS